MYKKIKYLKKWPNTYTNKMLLNTKLQLNKLNVHLFICVDSCLQNKVIQYKKTYEN